MTKRKKRRYAVRAIEIVLFLTALVALGATLFLLRGRDGEARSVEILEDRVRALRRLVTASQTYRDVIYTEHRRFLADKRLLFTIDYVVTAGVDFRKGLEIRVREDGTWEVSMPPAEILEVDADDASIEEIFIKETFGSIRLSDYMPIILEEREAIKNAAEAGNLLERAETNARSAVTRILRLGGAENVGFRTLTLPGAGEKEEGDGDGAS